MDCLWKKIIIWFPSTSPAMNGSWWEYKPLVFTKTNQGPHFWCRMEVSRFFVTLLLADLYTSFVENSQRELLVPVPSILGKTRQIVGPSKILLMEGILQQLMYSLSHHLKSFIHSRCCRISSLDKYICIAWSPQNGKLNDPCINTRFVTATWTVTQSVQLTTTRHMKTILSGDTRWPY